MREMPHLKYVDGNKRGYVVVDVTPERTQGQWFYVRDITQRDGHTETAGPSFSTRNGENRLQRDPMA
jgi:alkaline phosphatase D